jgi:hypothetical protein
MFHYQIQLSQQRTLIYGIICHKILQKTENLHHQLNKSRLLLNVYFRVKEDKLYVMRIISQKTQKSLVELKILVHLLSFIQDLAVLFLL